MEEKLLMICILFIFTKQVYTYSTPTEMTLYSTPLTWNEAYEFCKSQGKKLLSLEEEDKNEAFEIMITKDVLNNEPIDEFWIGLHAPDKRLPYLMQWTDTCNNKTFDKWAQQQPAVSNNKYCVYVRANKQASDTTFSWYTDNCSNNNRPFVCESSLDVCYYDMIDETKGYMEKGPRLENAPLTECEAQCRTYTSTTGKPCWAFTKRIADMICRILLSDDPFEADWNNGHSYDHRLYIKRSIKVLLDTTSAMNLDFTTSSVYPISNCFVEEAISTVATTKSTTTDPNDLDREISTAAISGSSASTEKTTQSSSTTEAEAITQSVARTMQVYASSEIATCDCDCNNRSITGLTISMSAILENIKIDKRKTSLSIRKKNSAADSRISSQSIGVVAVGFLVTCLLAVVLSDIVKFARYLWVRFSSYMLNIKI